MLKNINNITQEKPNLRLKKYKTRILNNNLFINIFNE